MKEEEKKERVVDEIGRLRRSCGVLKAYNAEYRKVIAENDKKLKELSARADALSGLLKERLAEIDELKESLAVANEEINRLRRPWYKRIFD